MKRLVFFVTLAIILAGLLLFVLSDTVISVADTSPSGREVASSVNETHDSNTVYTLPDV